MKTGFLLSETTFTGVLLPVPKDIKLRQSIILPTTDNSSLQNSFRYLLRVCVTTHAGGLLLVSCRSLSQIHLAACLYAMWLRQSFSLLDICIRTKLVVWWAQVHHDNSWAYGFSIPYSNIRWSLIQWRVGFLAVFFIFRLWWWQLNGLVI